jgi:hypothetical protein
MTLRFPWGACWMEKEDVVLFHVPDEVFTEVGCMFFSMRVIISRMPDTADFF